MRNAHLCSKAQLYTRLGTRTDNMLLWRQREREQGWGEGKEDKERVEGKPKEETEAKEKGREVQ